MNFPVDQPIIGLIYDILNTAGIGGVVVILFSGGTVLAFALTFYWIRQGGYVEDEEAVYTYPTPGLHEHEEHLPAGFSPIKPAQITVPGNRPRRP